MKTYSDPKLIKRNQNIGFWSSLLGPMLLAIGASFGITNGNLGLSLIFLILGFTFYQIGQGLRGYGQGADADFNEALKSLGDEYALFHFTTPADHLLVGPAGIWILIPRYGKGTVVYNEKRKRWRLQAVGMARVFGNTLTRPDLDLVRGAGRIDRHLQKYWQADEAPHLEAAVVLMSKDVKIDAAGAPVPTLHVSKLRGLIKTQEKKGQTNPQAIAEFRELFEPAPPETTAE